MQSLEARSQYRNSFHCAYRIFTEEGVLRFWTGTTPRLVRLVVSNFEGPTCHTPEITLVALGRDCLHRVRKGDCRHRRSILMPNHRRTMPHNIFLSIKPPGLHFMIPGLAHLSSRWPDPTRTSPSNSSLVREYHVSFMFDTIPHLPTLDGVASFLS